MVRDWQNGKNTICSKENFTTYLLLQRFNDSTLNLFFLFKTFQILSNSNELEITRQNATVDKIRRVAKHETAQQAVLAITWTLWKSKYQKSVDHEM